MTNKSSMDESIGALLQQFAEGKMDACIGALLHKKKKKRRNQSAKEKEIRRLARKRRNQSAKEKEIRRLARKLAKLLMKSINREGASPPQIVLKIENHFHARVEHITQ